MRLWHKDLITALPRKQLVGQWRECCAIARNIATKGSPNHVLVNKIMDYPIEHFITYSVLIASEMEDRGYKVNLNRFKKWIPFDYVPPIMNIFPEWHNDRYLFQCLFNLQEKFDRGAVTEEEWRKVERLYYGRIH